MVRHALELFLCCRLRPHSCPGVFLSQSLRLGGARTIPSGSMEAEVTKPHFRVSAFASRQSRRGAVRIVREAGGGRQRGRGIAFGGRNALQPRDQHWGTIIVDHDRRSGCCSWDVGTRSSGLTVDPRPLPSCLCLTASISIRPPGSRPRCMR